MKFRNGFVGTNANLHDGYYRNKHNVIMQGTEEMPCAWLVQSLIMATPKSLISLQEYHNEQKALVKRSYFW